MEDYGEQMINTKSLPRADGMVSGKSPVATSFELSNHLGNVLSTISDKKLQIED
jgi:hypothetical protein